MIGETGPLSYEEAIDVAYIEYNQGLLTEIVEQQIQDWTKAMDEPNSSRLHIRAEIQRLDVLKPRIDSLILAYRVEEPIDADFVQEIIEYLNTTDYDNLRTGRLQSRKNEPEHITDALENLSRRNSKLPEAA